MGPHKKVIGGTTSKGKDKTTAGGAASKRINNQPFAKGTTSATLQELSVAPNLHSNMETNCFKCSEK